MALSVVSLQQTVLLFLGFLKIICYSLLSVKDTMCVNQLPTHFLSSSRLAYAEVSINLCMLILG